jgi:uncharacterized glyoxalase superfamily protein PhnB
VQQPEQDVLGPSVVPVVLYADPARAIGWLSEAFGMQETFRAATPDGRILHAEVRWETGTVMVGQKPDGDRGAGFVAGPAWVYLVVDDPDAHHRTALAAGARITAPPGVGPGGSRGYRALDLEGNQWTFNRRRPALRPG